MLGKTWRFCVDKRCEEGPPSCAKTILVVDDNPHIRNLCRIAFEKAESGFLVHEASTGRQAVAAIEKTSFDLIVLDLCMPEMDGVEVLMRLRGHVPKLKIIGISGFLEGAMLSTVKVLGGTATLAKPFDPDDLVLLATELLSSEFVCG